MLYRISLISFSSPTASSYFFSSRRRHTRSLRAWRSAVCSSDLVDTGRRPEDILGLPLDCLARDADGAPVLVYDNAKAHRLGRRLPVSEATATVITAQQARVRARFPATPVADLK